MTTGFLMVQLILVSSVLSQGMVLHEMFAKVSFSQIRHLANIKQSRSCLEVEDNYIENCHLRTTQIAFYGSAFATVIRRAIYLLR